MVRPRGLLQKAPRRTQYKILQPAKILNSNAPGLGQGQAPRGWLRGRGERASGGDTRASICGPETLIGSGGTYAMRADQSLNLRTPPSISM